MPGPYTPLDSNQLAETIVRMLQQQDPVTLPPGSEKNGAGLYLLYYLGPSPLYVAISGEKCETPIYVGKAVPKGGRTGGGGVDAARVEGDGSDDIDLLSRGLDDKYLFNRLGEHAETINAVADLSIDDFRCRYLITEPLWIPLGEQLLIRRYQPVWNVALTGFGNHDPGKGRENQQRSRWDTLYRGRGWAERLQPLRKGNGLASPEDMVALVVDQFARHRYLKSGTININTASILEIAGLGRGVGEGVAARIIAHRNLHGPFANAEELSKVRGIGPIFLEKWGSKIRFSDTNPRRRVKVVWERNDAPEGELDQD